MSEMHNVFSERRVIGAILNDPPKYWTAAKIVNSGMFRDPMLREIFEDCRLQVNAAGNLSIGRIIEVARRRAGDSATAAVMELQGECVSSVMLPADSEIVRKLWMARSAVEMCGTAAKGIEDDPMDPSLQISRASAALAGLNRSSVMTESSDLELVEDVEGLVTSAGCPICLPLGHGHLVQRRGELTILCAVPGAGKSTFVLQMADWFGEHVGRSRVHSMEMKRRQVARRLMAKDLVIEAGELWGQRISMESPRWKAFRESRGIKLTIDDKSGIPVEDLCGACMEQHSRQPLSFVAVDYLQLMTVANPRKGSSTADETGVKSHALKQLAMDLDIPVMALAQFNREGKKKDRPSIYDLDGGGAIENDADQIWVMHRSGVIEGSPAMTLSIDKHREGYRGDLELYPEFQHFRFIDGVDPNKIEGAK